MVADKVEIITKSFKDEAAAHWTCDGSPEYTLVELMTKLKEELKLFYILLKILQRFLRRRSKVRGLLTKYNRFNQVPIKFGTKKINDPEHEPATITDPEDAVEETKEPHRQIEVDDIINNTNPAWTKKPADLEK